MKISVVIPVYNTEKYLPACLDSVLNQTHRGLEVICVNDGSPDDSASILAEYAARDSRVRVLTQENHGQAATRAAGAAAASGEWIGFVDSDDTVQPDMFERLLANGEKYSADISCCGMTYIYPDGHTVPHFGSGDVLEMDHAGGIRELLEGGRIEPSMCNKLYRASLVKNAELGSSVRNNEDFVVNFNLFSKAERSVFEDVCLYNYFRREGTMSADSESVRVLRDTLAARKFIWDNADDAARADAFRCWLSTVVNLLNRLCVQDGADAKAFYDECLTSLKENAGRIGCLSKKQRFAAELHLRAPSVIRAIYRIYGRISLYRYEH